MLSFGLPAVVHPGEIFPNVSVLGKLCIHVFANGVMKKFFTRYLNIWKKMPPMRTLVFTQQQLELIKAVQIQKRGRKFRSKSAYWHKFRWKNNQNPCSCRRTGKPGIHQADCRANSRQYTGHWNIVKHKGRQYTCRQGIWNAGNTKIHRGPGS